MLCHGVAMEHGGVVAPCARYGGLPTNDDDEGDFGRRSSAASAATEDSGRTYASTCDDSEPDEDEEPSLDEGMFRDDGQPLLSASQDDALDPDSITACHWGLMTLIMYIYALINTSMALYVLPSESRRMHSGTGGR